MSKGSSFLIDGSFQVKLLNDVARAEVEVVPDNSNNVSFGASVFRRSVSVNVNRERIGKADGVRDLKEGSVSKTRCDK